MNFLSLFFILNVIFIARSEIVSHNEDEDLKEFYDKCAVDGLNSLPEKDEYMQRSEKFKDFLHMSYVDANWTISRNQKYGFVFSLEVDSNVHLETVNVNGVSLNLKSFYFWVNKTNMNEATDQSKKIASLELYLLHEVPDKSPQEYETIVIPFVETKDENHGIQQLINLLSGIHGESNTKSFNLANMMQISSKLIHQSSSVLYYERNNKTSDCPLNITWDVFSIRLIIGKEQLRSFVSALEGTPVINSSPQTNKTPDSVETTEHVQGKQEDGSTKIVEKKHIEEHLSNTTQVDLHGQTVDKTNQTDTNSNKREITKTGTGVHSGANARVNNPFTISCLSILFSFLVLVF